MTRAKFEALVRDMEPFAKQQPQAYQFLAGALAALGYTYIFLVLAVVVALLVGLVALLALGVVAARGAAILAVIKVGIPVGLGLLALIGTILRAFQVSVPAPEGVPLTRAGAPRLFAMLDELCATLRAPRFHHILLTDDFNAGVAQVPRLGMLGWQSNYLVLGLPLMQALAPEQFRAVVAHEAGHLSRRHSWFAGWVYRLRQTWFQLLTQLESEGHRGAWVFYVFFGWYAPFFQAYTFVLARSNEYVADRCAAEVAGRQATAEALVAIGVRGRFLQDGFWPDLFRDAQHRAEPPAAPFATMFQALGRTEPHADTERWLEEALGERAGIGDTHPSLTDRLAALGYQAVPAGPLDLPKPPLAVPSPPTETAAQRYLGPAAGHYAAQFDQHWRQGVAVQWGKQHQEAKEARRKLDLLTQQSRQEALSEAETWELAELTFQFDGPDVAVPLVQKMLALDAKHGKANYVLGRILLDQHKAQGLYHLEKGMAGDPERTAAGCEAAYWFLRSQGRLADAAKYRQRAKECRDQWERARQERDAVGPDDRFLPHGLSPDEAQRLRVQFSNYGDIGAAFLVRKAVRNFPERPLYVLAIVPATPWYHRRSDEDDHEMASWIVRRLILPGETTLILTHRSRALARTIQSVSGAQIYRKHSTG